MKATSNSRVSGSRGRPTVLDVARIAEVGASTVSRYLRGSKSVSAAVSERIAFAVRQLGYQPNELARGLRGGSTNTIGIVFPQVTNLFFSNCVQIAEEEARKSGYTVMLLTHQENPEIQASHLATLQRYRVDGIILTAAEGTDIESFRLQAGNIPIVALDRPLWKECPSVLLKNRDAGKIATQHMLSHGHKDIVCVTTSQEMYTFKERLIGYTQIMRQAGLQPRVLTAVDYQQLIPEVTRFLKSADRPAALLSLSNMATFSAVSAAKGLGIYFGKTWSFIGFDDFDFAPLLESPLTTVRQPAKEIALAALQLLFQQMAGPNSKVQAHIRFAAELMLRSSCGCLFP
jgi:LacI family transcriptional regulator